MCTLTLFATPQGYLLGMNRDEQRIRPVALELYKGEIQKDLKVVYPIDPQGGGTWLGVNQNGLSIALLNQNPVDYIKSKTALNSRGILIPKLLSCESANIALKNLAMFDLKYFAPFQIVAIDSAQVAYSAKWNGLKLEAYTHNKPPFLATSSSWNESEVQEYRKLKFNDFLKSNNLEQFTLKQLMKFHLQKEDGFEAKSIYMQRQDAMTVSMSFVEMMGDKISFHYKLSSPYNKSSLYEEAHF